MTIDEKMAHTSRCIERCEQTLTNPEISPSVKSVYREAMVQHITELKNLAEGRKKEARPD